MFFGMAAVAAGLGAFYYSQLYFHKGDDQTCEFRPALAASRAFAECQPTVLQRQNQKVDDKDANLRIVGGKQDPILKPKASTYISTPPSQ